MHTKTDLLSVDESLRQVLINNHILSSVGAMHLNYKIYYFSRSLSLSLFFFSLVTNFLIGAFMSSGIEEMQ